MSAYPHAVYVVTGKPDNEHVAGMSVWERVSDRRHLVGGVRREGYLKE